MQNATWTKRHVRVATHARLRPMRRCVGGALIVILASLLVLISGEMGDTRPSMPGGELHILDDNGHQVGVCPLKQTDVEASISGFVSRVRLRQTEDVSHVLAPLRWLGQTHTD
jgi:hypothetical protein